MLGRRQGGGALGEHSSRLKAPVWPRFQTLMTHVLPNLLLLLDHTHARCMSVLSFCVRARFCAFVRPTQAFRHFDPEGVGFVDEPEMRRMLKQLAEEEEVHPLAEHCAPCATSKCGTKIRQLLVAAARFLSPV